MGWRSGGGVVHEGEEDRCVAVVGLAVGGEWAPAGEVAAVEEGAEQGSGVGLFGLADPPGVPVGGVGARCRLVVPAPEHLAPVLNGPHVQRAAFAECGWG